MRIYKHIDGWQSWYDRSIKMWVGAKFNSIGDQIGECLYAPTKELMSVYIGYEEGSK